MIHLDTSFLVDLLRQSRRGKGGPALDLLATLHDEEIALSVHVLCELRAGAELARGPAEEHRRVDALCAGLIVVAPEGDFARRYGAVLADLERRGERIATMDLLIATAALVAGAALVTRNARHFERVPGLRVLTY